LLVYITFSFCIRYSPPVGTFHCFFCHCLQVADWIGL